MASHNVLRDFKRGSTAASVAELKARALKATELNGKLTSTLAREQLKIDSQRRMVDLENEKLSPSARQHMQSEYAKRLADQRRTTLQASSEDRWSTLKALDSERLAAREARKSLGNPRALLSRYLMDPDAARYYQTFRDAGPATLRDLAAHAANTGDAKLASALCLINDQTRTEDRFLDSSALSEAVVGEEAKAARAYADEIEGIFDRAILENREIEHGKGPTAEKIAVGLKRQAAEPLPEGYDMEDDESNNNPPTTQT